jgi:hypothetical protein
MLNCCWSLSTYGKPRRIQRCLNYEEHSWRESMYVHKAFVWSVYYSSQNLTKIWVCKQIFIKARNINFMKIRSQIPLSCKNRRSFYSLKSFPSSPVYEILTSFESRVEYYWIDSVGSPYWQKKFLEKTNHYASICLLPLLLFGSIHSSATDILSMRGIQLNNSTVSPEDWHPSALY